MDTTKNLIIIKGKDKTKSIMSCEYNDTSQKYDIIFYNDPTKYEYGKCKVQWMINPKIFLPNFRSIKFNGKELSDIKNIYVFKNGEIEYWHIKSVFFEKTYLKSDLIIDRTYVENKKKKPELCMEYLEKLAAASDMKNNSGENILKKHYDKLKFVNPETVLANYINPEKYKSKKYESIDLIFPFGGNKSQFEAVHAAMTNQVSVIQGPPGTGKTQTILNIIANLLVAGKVVQVVASNGSATHNILEKLDSAQYNMGFLVAPLGKLENKEIFIKNQTGSYPDLSEWEMDVIEQEKLKDDIKGHSSRMNIIFKKQDRLAQVNLELDSLILEMKHFEEFCLNYNLGNLDEHSRCTLKSEKIMELWQECDYFSERERGVSLWYKIKATFIYRIADWKFHEKELLALITLLQTLFYKSKKAELEEECENLNKELKEFDAKIKMKELTESSLRYLRAVLFKRYRNKNERVKFEADKSLPGKEFVEEYPIILSTTYSSRSCIANFFYDYVIMDEASQVDIATGALSLSGAKNAVIVGDLKQLPNVVKAYKKVEYRNIFSQSKLPSAYSYYDNSFLKSICEIIPDIKQTLLREHYRCHPMIINFCNQKFYDNQLIIMTKDNGEKDTLSVIRTNKGNHCRDRVNQRQIDVLIKEAFPSIELVEPDNIGIISPYKDHAEEAREQVGNKEIDVYTVHKYQGREKDNIIITTVDDVVTDFSDDSKLINVAISRAKKKLCLIVSGNEQPPNSNIEDFIRYIEYHSFKVEDSKIYSVFDLLYQQYTEKRITFLRKYPKVSKYASENLMYGTIVEILREYENVKFRVNIHQPLHSLIKDLSYLNDMERQFVLNAATHLDFIIYKPLTKKVVLAIEVDGYHYHKKGTKQHKRDEMKDGILNRYGISFIRLPTNGSGEREIIRKELDNYVKCG